MAVVREKFDIHNKKVFKDAVHGYVYIPQVFVKNIIDTPEFQRLRTIEQTGMRVVYPSARHDRFSHSIGVFCLGEKAVDALLCNFQDKAYWNIFTDTQRDVYWAKNKVLFLIACLLHDIGHAPFSHSTENFYCNNESYNKIKNALKMIFKGELTDDEIEEQFYNYRGEDAPLRSQPHEIVSAIIVYKFFKERIKYILNELEQEKFPHYETSIGEYCEEPEYINSSHIDDDIKFIIRMIAGIPYHQHDVKYQIRNCFIELLNGGFFDVDKLDYILRDTQMSGIENIDLDVERLLIAITIVPITCFKDYIFKESELNVDVIEMETSKNSISMIGSIIGDIDINFPENCTFYSGASYNGFTAHSIKVKQTTEIPVDDKNSIYVDSRQGQTQLAPANCYQVSIGKSKFKSDFMFQGSDDLELKSKLNVSQYNGKLEMNVKSQLSSISLRSVKFNGIINGSVNNMIILGNDYIKANKLLPSENIFCSFKLGFKKTALSVIQNVLNARNYLYLWIYAHHKVVYSANYLIIEMLQLAFRNYKIEKEELISLDMSTNVDDVTIMQFLRDAYDEIKMKKNEAAAARNGEMERFCLLFEEYRNRKYKISLLKSHAEYDQLFSSLDINKQKTIRQRLAYRNPPVYNDKKSAHSVYDVTYGYITDVSVCGQDVNEIIWVDASPRLKQMNDKNIYIEFLDGSIITMDKINVLKSQERDSTSDHYVYFYCSDKDGQTLSIDQKKNLLKRILTYCESLI